MKFFVSGKVGHENDAKKLMDLLRKAGHEITFDWTTISHLRPYDANVAASREAAVLEASGVKDADVLVVVADDRGVGMFVELGIAIGVGIPVRIINNKESRSMFFHHPLVRQVKDMEEIFTEFSPNQSPS